MAAADIGANFDNYQGNAVAGGFASGAIKIDTTPIQNLAQYAFEYNKAAWQQKVKEQDTLVTELAKASSLDLNSLIPEEKKQLLDKYDALNKDAVDIAKRLKSGSVDYTTARLEWADKLKKATDAFDIANTRYKSKASREEQIAKETDPAMKAYLQKKLDQDIKSTTVEQPIPSLQGFDLKKAEIPKPNMAKFDVPIYDDNSNFLRNDTFTIVDQKDINAQAASIALGLTKLKVDKNSPEYLSKSPEEKKLLDQQQEAFDASGKLAEVAASEHYNAALKQYIVDGKLDIEKIKSKNSTLAGVMSTMDNYNQKMLDMQRRIDAGEFKDSSGRNYLDKNDYQTISYLDGDISAEDLLKPQLLAKADAEKIESKVTPTDNKIQKETLDQNLKIAQMKEAGDNARARINEAGANYRAKLAQDGENARAAAKAATGATTVEGGEFGNLLYSVNSPRVVPIKHEDGSTTQAQLKGGVLVDKEGNPTSFSGRMNVPVGYFDNSIATEYNKYIGKPDADGELKGVVGKLRISNGNYVAQFENGVIKGLYTDDGTLASDNQFAHITQVAGQAGATKYKKPDTNYGADKPNSLATPSKKEISRADIATKAEAAGYTPKEYEELLKKNGITIK